RPAFSRWPEKRPQVPQGGGSLLSGRSWCPWLCLRAESFQERLRERVGCIGQSGHPMRRWQQVLHSLDALACQLSGHTGHPGYVPGRPREVGDQTVCERVTVSFDLTTSPADPKFGLDVSRLTFTSLLRASPMQREEARLSDVGSSHGGWR